MEKTDAERKIIRDGDICKYQYRYHINIFVTTISIHRYDIDIFHPLKTLFSIFHKVHCYPCTYKKREMIKAESAGMSDYPNND